MSKNSKGLAPAKKTRPNKYGSNDDVNHHISVKLTRRQLLWQRYQQALALPCAPGQFSGCAEILRYILTDRRLSMKRRIEIFEDMLCREGRL